MAYRSLPARAAACCARRVGETLERLYPAQLEEYYAQLAYHYSRSDHQEKALEYLVKTGHKAAHRYANREASMPFSRRWSGCRWVKSMTASWDNAPHCS